MIINLLDIYYTEVQKYNNSLSSRYSPSVG